MIQTIGFIIETVLPLTLLVGLTIWMIYAFVADGLDP